MEVEKYVEKVMDVSILVSMFVSIIPCDQLSAIANMVVVKKLLVW